MRKGLLIAVVSLLLVLSAVFVACHKTNEDPTVQTVYDVSQGTIAVGAAMQKAMLLEGAENVYVSFQFEVDRGVDTYKELYDFAAILDLDDDRNCALSFKQRTDKLNVISTEMYYADGVLYLNSQPAIDRAAVNNVSLSQIASTLTTSAQSGQIGALLQILPAVGDRIFSKCERTADGELITYTFEVDYSAIGTGIAYLASQTGLMSSADMTRLLGLGNLTIGNATKFDFVTRSVEGVGEVFVSAACHTDTAAGDATAKNLTSFTCRMITDAQRNQPQYQVTLPDNLSSFVYYHPANLNMVGTFTAAVNSSSRNTYLGAQPLVTSFDTHTYVWDVNLQSNVDVLGKWTASLTLTNQQDRSRRLGLFYDNSVLYVDLSSLNMGSWRLTAAELQDIATDVGRARTASTLSAADYRDILLDLLVDREAGQEQVRYRLKADNIVKLYNAVQQKLTQNALLTLPPVAVDDLQVDVNTQNNTFHSLTVKASVWGCDLTLAADNPSVGRTVNVATPQWVEGCIDPLRAANITPTAHGVINSYTQAGNNTALLEAFIESVSGTAVDFGNKEVYYYSIAANVSGKGKINVISADFTTNALDPVCSLYYHADTPDNLYLIMPAVGGTTEVRTLTLKREMRYVNFVRAINGNTEIRELNECTLSNAQKGLSFTYSAAGLDALLAKLNGTLTQQSVAALPKDLGLQALRVTIGADRAVRLIFAGERFIEFGLDSVAVTDASLALRTDLHHAAVSYFDAYNLPSVIEATWGDGNAQQRAVTRLRLADFDAEWSFAHVPEMGSGMQAVTANCTVFGQVVNLDFNVDCTRPTTVEVSNVDTYSGKLSDKVFTFARYREDVSPIEVVQSYQYVKVTMGMTTRELPLVWLHGGRIIDEADWSTPDSETDNYSNFILLPAVRNFFGRIVPLDSYRAGEATFALAGAYTLRLEGTKINTVANADTYLTLRTYGTDSYSPFAQETYNAANPQFRNANGVSVSNVGKVLWNIDSIKNKTQLESGIYDPASPVNNKAYYTDAQLVEALRAQLYALSGRYTVAVDVYNTLDVIERSITVTILVQPYVMQSVTFEQLADGVAYEAETGDYMGRFDVASRTRNSIAYNYAFAKVAVVTFANGVVQRFDAKDWTVQPIEAPIMFKSYTDGVVLSLGDAAGGRQNLPMHYVVAATPVDGVRLWGYQGERKVELGAKQDADADTVKLQFALEHLNPYDYVYPAGLVVYYTDAEPQYVPCDFDFVDWDETKLWHNTTPYVATQTVYNVEVSVSMQFDEKRVTGAWEFVNYVEAADGAYVFVGGEFVAYNSLLAAHQNRTRYNVLIEENVIYQESSSGAYVKPNDEYVRYDATNPAHRDLQHYTRDTIVARPYFYEEAVDGAYVYVDRVHVAYDPDDEAHQGLTRYNRTGTVNVLYREGTDNTQRLVLDPNKVDYLSAETYPTLVVVTFADGSKAVLHTVWDLSALTTVRPDQQYTETVGLLIGLNQPLADVYMRIEPTKPKAAYYKVDLDEHGEPVIESNNYVNGTNEVSLTLLDVDGSGNLVVNPLGTQETIHAIVCGCADPDCLGYLYFEYGDSTTANARFAITEWRGLELIGDTLKALMASNNGIALQEQSFTVTVTAVAHNISNDIVVNVRASNMAGVYFNEEGWPLVASALSTAGTSVYSMTAVGTDITIDPYVADIFDAANYPKQLTFSVGGKACKAYRDEWDLSALAGMLPYEGGTATVYALIHTLFGDIKVASHVTVRNRSIQTVKVDGSEGRNFYVDVMSAEPFGEDVVEENGRTIALKKVKVKFVQDDTWYDMNLRYDITDFAIATSASGELSKGSIDVQVGNEAGGYQTLSGYRVYTKVNEIIQVAVPNTDSAYADIKAYMGEGWDGNIYGVNGFIAFDDSEAANTAWRALTMLNESLVLRCGYIDDGENLQVTEYTATLGERDTLGIGYAWERATMAGKDVLRLEVWNTVALADDHIDSVQYVSTGTNRYISLVRGMLNITAKPGATAVDNVNLDLSYKKDNTVAKLLADYMVAIAAEQLTDADITQTLYAADDHEYASPLAGATRLTVGSYVWRIAVKAGNVLYVGNVDIAVEVSPYLLDTVTVYNNDQPISNNGALLGGYTHNKKTGFLALTVRDSSYTTTVSFRYYRGEEVNEDNRMTSAPDAVGVYTICLVCSDDGYRVDLSNGAVAVGVNSFLLTIIDE